MPSPPINLPRPKSLVSTVSPMDSVRRKSEIVHLNDSQQMPMTSTPYTPSPNYSAPMSHTTRPTYITASSGKYAIVKLNLQYMIFVINFTHGKAQSLYNLQSWGNIRTRSRDKLG